MPISDYTEFSVDDPNGRAKKVFTFGRGPGVVILHELPGLTPEDIALADRLAAEGFQVFLPLLFGEPGQNSPLSSALRLCISRELEFIAAKGSTPNTMWLRSVCQAAASETGGPVGVIGLCLTGGLVLALIADERIAAAVTAEPALPIPIPFTSRGSELGLSPEELDASKLRVERDQLPILGLRFSNDSICPNARFVRLQREFGTLFEGLVIKSPDEAFKIGSFAHATLSTEYRSSPENHPTRLAYTRVVEFLNSRLRHQVNVNPN